MASHFPPKRPLLGAKKARSAAPRQAIGNFQCLAHVIRISEVEQVFAAESVGGGWGAAGRGAAGISAAKPGAAASAIVAGARLVRAVGPGRRGCVALRLHGAVVRIHRRGSVAGRGWHEGDACNRRVSPLRHEFQDLRLFTRSHAVAGGLFSSGIDVRATF